MRDGISRGKTVRTRIFFATDIHGSETCFLKFLNTPKVYKANVLILGGDITGKLIVPIVEHKDGAYRANFLGVNHTLKGEEEIRGLEKRISVVGFYSYRTSWREVEEFKTDERRLDELFSRLMVERVRRWISLAEERLRDPAVTIYISGGNDDRFVIDEPLRSSSRVIDPEGTVVNVNETREMISLGWTNPTPWNTPRECSEDALERKLEDLISGVKDVKNCIFNAHAPPIDSGLDACPKLDENLRPIFVGGQPLMFGAGSIAVRKAIEKYQPLLGLHGHIHESRGVARIGRTLCLNPGSEYSEGILRGVIVDIDERGVRSHLFTSG